MTLDVNDTIVAIASAPGGALRGILRLSGPSVLETLNASVRSAESLDSIRVARVIAATLELEHELQLPGDLYFWPTNRSYTRQPSAEFHTIGSPPLLQLGLRKFCDAGARLARPGEFTLRAFLAGRLDLTQAEAVLGVIDAESNRQLSTALNQLAGGLSELLNATRDQLLNLCADLEAGLDFVEDDISFVSHQQIGQRLRESSEVLRSLETQMSSRTVDIVQPTAVLVGAPNAGKSSLLNALVEDEAAIVSEVAGTTRDYVTQQIKLGELSCTVIDTAGIDAAQPSGLNVEAQRKTREQAEQARLVIHCIDGSQPLDEELGIDRNDRLLVITKCDLPMALTPPAGSLHTSAVTGAGIGALRQQLERFFVRDAGSSSDVLASTAARCRDSIQLALAILTQAASLNDSAAGEELIAAEIRLALCQLGEIVGAIYTDDILDRVFSRFCIGK